jgi:DNA-binding GntR family transcriptional regulator
MFHLKVVSAGKNDVLKSLFMKIIPDLFALFDNTKEQNSKEYFKSIHEHNNIIDHLNNQNKAEAAEAMKLHLENWKE